jgi:hypothetical protein
MLGQFVKCEAVAKLARGVLVREEALFPEGFF